MKVKIVIGQQGGFDVDTLTQMYRLRARIFGERLGWDVAVRSGMEIDDYDALSPYYMLVRDESDAMCGCWRLLPTQGPYMLRDTFAPLLHGQAAPASPRIWELSRFAVVSPARAGFGLGELTLEAMRAIVTFADGRNITSYVTVTTTALERLLVRAGIATRRFGPPMRIGKVNAVALSIDLGAQTHAALFGSEQASASASDRFEQPLGAADEGAAGLVKAQQRVHLARQADALGSRDASAGRSVGGV